jgi:hypothetical protein
VNRATAIFHALADRPPVNIQPDVIHSLHGGASSVSPNQRPLSSALYTMRSSFDLRIQTGTYPSISTEVSL